MRIERLEDRLALSVSPYINADGRLTIIGTDESDIVEVGIQPGVVEVSWSETGSDAIEVHQFPRIDVKTLYFRGNDGNDTFKNNTTIRSLAYGNDGDDRLIGGGSRDQFHGGAGADTLEGNGGKDYLHGDRDNDILRGGEGNDVLYGFYGDDELYGGVGNDYLSGYDGDDRLFGEDGDDTIYGYLGDDYMDGGLGRDFMHGHQGDDEVHGGDGDDYITTWHGDDVIYAGEGNDRVRAHEGNDFVDAGGGDDLVYGWLGDDVLIGGAGNDYLSGYKGEDRLDGDAGDDLIAGHEGNDIINGGAGNDRIYAWKGDDIVDGGDGDDHLSGYWGDDILRGGDGDDLIKGHEGNDEIYGEAGNDRVFGWKGDDFIDGGAGQDYLSGSYDNDTIHGGADDDEINGGVGDDTLYGDAGMDHLIGGSGNDYLDGGLDNDMLCGGSGDDTLIGREGEDTLNGMSGNDLVRFDDTLDAIALDLTRQIATQNGSDEAVKFSERAIGSLGDDMFTLAKPVDGAVYGIDGTDGYDVLSLLDFTEDDVELIDGQLVVSTPEMSFTVNYQNLEKIELADNENLFLKSELVNVIYINDSARNLVSYNTETNEFVMIGKTSVVMTDIAISADGRMFGTTFRGLYEIDPETANATFIANYGDVHTMNALAFLPDGTLVATGYNTSALFSVDVATAELTELGPIDAASSGDLAFHEGQLLMTTTDGRLIAIDLSGDTFATSTIGPVDLLTYGIASQGNDDLYAGVRSSLYALDDDTAASTLVDELQSQGVATIYGMAAYNEVVADLLEA